MTQIIIYTTPTCPWCAKTKEFLKQNKLNYLEKNVVEDERARTELIRKSGQMGVPVLDIDGKIVVGFEPEEILAAVTRKKSFGKVKSKVPKRKAKKKRKEKLVKKSKIVKKGKK